MPGPGPWESWLLLLLATFSIVIANQQYRHQRQRDNTERHSNRIDQGSPSKQSNNATADAQDDTSLQLRPLRVPHLRHHHVTHWGPYFENAEDQDVTDVRQVALHLGANATLDCRVAMLSDKKVIWMRRNADRVSLLTVADTTYSSDLRYSLSFQYPNNWRLAISSVERDDHGLYVCQVNTHPPRMLTVNVTVLAPEIRIVDEAGHEVGDRYYKTGSGVELACIVRVPAAASREATELQRPIWLKNGKNISEHVSVYRVNGTDDKLITKLYVDRASKSDSGKYTCLYDKRSESTVHLHVLNGEKQAAVHHDQWNAGETSLKSSSKTILAAPMIFILYRAMLAEL